MSEAQEIDEEEARYERWLLDAEDAEERRSAAFWRERLCVLLREQTGEADAELRGIVARAPLDVVMFLCAQIPDDRYYIRKLQEFGEFKRRYVPFDPEFFDAEPEGEVVVLYSLRDSLRVDPATWERYWSPPFDTWLQKRRARAGGGPRRPTRIPETPETSTEKAARYNSLFIALVIALGVAAIQLLYRC